MTAEAGKDSIGVVDLAGEQDFALGTLTVRPSLGEVEIGGQTERLEPRVMQVLVVLAHAAGRVVSRDELIARCWGGTIVGDDAINRVIGRVRRLSERVPRPFTLETVPRIGYRLIAAAPAEGAVAPTETTAPSRWAQLRILWRKPWARAMVAALAVLTVGLAAWLATGQGGERARRVAVLPISSPAGDAALRTIADGVADDIATALTPSGIEVLARPMTSGDLRTRLSWARSVGAAYAVEGAVQQVDDDVHVTTRIVSTGDPVARWSQTIVQPKAKLRDLRYAAAARTADAVHCGFKPGADRLDSESQTLLFQACSLNRDPDPSSVFMVRDTFQRLRRREPRLAYAHAAFAVTSVRATIEGRGPLPKVQREALRLEAQQAADVAHRLDRNLGEAYVAQHLLVVSMNPALHEAPLKEGLRRDELNPQLNGAYGNFLMRVGRVREALVYVQRAAGLDPLSPDRAGDVTFLLFAAGEMAQAHRRAEALAVAWPGDGNIDLSRLRGLFWSGRYEDALAFVPPQDKNRCWRRSVDWLRRTDATGRRAGAREALACHDNEDLGPIQTLMLLSALDVDTAYDLVEKWRRQRASQAVMTWNYWGAEGYFLPPTAPLRADPRFMPLMRELGFLDYWRTTGQWPDFCSEPGLPYNCREVAARLSGPAPR